MKDLKNLKWMWFH